MKKIFLIFVAALFIYSCTNKKTKLSLEDIKNEKATINQLLNNWHKDASEINSEDYFARMDSISIFIGTDASENWTKEDFQAYCRPYFKKGKSWDFKTLERNVYLNNTGSFVWFDELLDTWMGTCRGSGVLEKVNNSWKIKHYVLSVTIPNDDVQAVILAKKKNDSIFLRKFK